MIGKISRKLFQSNYEFPYEKEYINSDVKIHLFRQEKVEDFELL